MKRFALLSLAPLLAAQNPPQPNPGQAPAVRHPGVPGAAARPLEPMLLPQAVVLPRGGAAIEIDGSLLDWPELPALRLDDQRQLSGTALNAWHGPADCSGMVFLLWDEQHLWLAATVKDEWHRALDANTLLLTEVPAADAIVVTFDPERDTRGNGPDPGRREDREFWLADENAREVLQWDRLRGQANVLDPSAARMVVTHGKELGITSYEAKIPWREILPPGRQPAAGLVLDLQLVINDFDESTDGMPQTRIGWTFGCGPVIDPGLLGSIMLVADAAALQGKVPDFPPKPGVPLPDFAKPEVWQALTARLLQQPPAVHDGSAAPEAAGGVQRLALLEELDGHCERFPRVDWLELHQRSHRRMNREVAGLCARGLPSWWRERLRAVSKAAEDPVPNATVRLFRLPMGGWLVRTAQRSFVVDAAGPDVAEWLWGGTEFCLLTQPLDPSRRNDQLLVRMLSAKPPRPVMTHLVFHLPVIGMGDMPLAELGATYGQPTGVRVQALGSKRPDGAVEGTASYRVWVPAGPRLLFAGPTLRVEDCGDEPVEALVVSSRNDHAVRIAERLRPGLVVLDDTFVCQSYPGVPRVALREQHNFQKALQPHRSVLLAPGESWDIATGK